MKVLQISAHFKPNIGGVETHLVDLVNVLTKKGWKVCVLTYQPLTTKAAAKIYEKKALLTIIRLPWFPGLFYKLIAYPILEFLYLLPGLFIVTPLVIMKIDPDTIHAHGLVAGFAGIFWGKIFRKRVLISTHSIYSFPKKGLYRSFVYSIMKSADYCLGLSEQAVKEIISLGIEQQKVKKFTYWINLNMFKPQGLKQKTKKQLGWGDKFIVLFVGRLITEKGIEVLLSSAKNWDFGISLKIIGTGPLEKKIKERLSDLLNVELIGAVEAFRLPVYYNGADVLIVPSIHEEGFGRVILEALACGTPVIGSNKGAISEAIDETVGKLIEVSSDSITDTIKFYYHHQERLKYLASHCRKFAERRYSEKNAESIIELYK